jgi:O-6-methylguanine DNA methyltransferase
MTVRYGSVDTPIGRLWLAMSERGLCRISFEQPEQDFSAELQRAAGTTPLRDEAAVEPARRQVLEYLAGQRRSFDLPLDVQGPGEFGRRALEACAAIPYGDTRSYGDLARELGSPGAARAVGSAMAHNPIPLVIPCHRVLGSDGRLHGFGGGLNVKEWLLRLESGAVGESQGSRASR